MKFIGIRLNCWIKKLLEALKSSPFVGYLLILKIKFDLAEDVFILGLNPFFKNQIELVVFYFDEVLCNSFKNGFIAAEGFDNVCSAQSLFIRLQSLLDLLMFEEFLLLQLTLKYLKSLHPDFFTFIFHFFLDFFALFNVTFDCIFYLKALIEELHIEVLIELSGQHFF